MTASGLLGTVEVHSWWKDLGYFHQYISRQIHAISRRVHDEPVVVYGAGAHSEEFRKEFSALNVVAFSDSNAALWGHTLLGLPIIEPDKIRELARHVVISSRVWDRDIDSHLKQTYPELSIYPLYEQLLEQNKTFLDSQIDTVLARFTKNQFDLIFYCPASPAEAFTREHFARLRNHFKAKFATAWWDYDDSNATNEFMQFERCSLEYSDMVIDPGNFTKNARLIKREYPFHLHTHVDKLHVLPTAYNPRLFYPRPKDWSNPLALFGSIVGERRKWKQILEQQFPTQFRHIGGVYQGRTPLPMAEFARLTGVTPIIVSTQTYEFRSQCKGRVREILACAGLLIEQENPETRIYFGDFSEIDYFSDQEKLLALLDYYLRHPAEAEERAMTAHRWYQKNWSARPWTEKFLQALGS